MKLSKLSLVLTALFTHMAIESLHIVTIQTERIIKESQRGLKIQNKIE